MNPIAKSSAQKHAWCETPRETPLKTPAGERVQNFSEIYAIYDEETARAQARRCLQCPHPGCRTGCPLNNRIPEWLALAADGDFLGAAEVSQSTSNMPEICSRVCPQERLCESQCILESKGAPICIGALEKFVNEYAFAHGGIDVTRPEPNGFHVAVIGAGPGGLACADELAVRGYAVTVFEAQELPGGLLMGGIPAFKLEKDIVLRRVHVLEQRGVQFYYGITAGRDVLLTQLTHDFDAVFLGIGAQKPRPLDVPGADLIGVFQGLPFLIQKNVNAPSTLPPIDVAGKRVIVLGGGDSAMDCLRTAIRCGASQALCLYRRDLANMPGSRKEYSNAIEEGAEFQFLTKPVAVEGEEGHVQRVRCVRMELGEPDASGRRKPRTVKGSEFLVPADVVLISYGFDPVPFPPESDFARIAVNDWGAFITDENQMTSVPGIFSGGDAVRGPSLVVHAVRDGREAAAGIHAWLAKMPVQS
jgi:glutamate synthase (NADPH/NADH) small chain